MAATMFEQIGEEIKAAMKSKDKDRLEALRYLKSMLLENKTSVKPKEEMDVLVAHVKKMKDSLENFPKGSELYEKTSKEVAILTEYLPAQLDEAAVIKLIGQIKGSLTNPNMGMIMKELTPKIKGQFDGKRASQLVQEALK
ncbi:MAG: hypothetical protein A2504_11245 [Bdellovibrionales bacterium RIFOXYD12_FULL_39_22]|nr:MAG: hypothetical protein A2385_09810 [Bdellovibrionales bacterium RIFOXYB1_FULL_39_21]OFZ44247.1 MAG: hypothetical protein A2485_07430 [Bdellovibrionales bacterium RIFOXYC12_FULL_39_17]OFZ46789.1 MAG: hypothetical protein A2404_04665 [Bdellovibrionales bacterium RIFOXYC1_FULL_39_130]OFZ70373.1 MAG: hypothetical protein A2451_03155 [Bdellovibrionales bacterium RIFOXYC2_FULL_39_8]OFZ75934.1 MAG: hypothetical protein A2560_02485 [Bdellovibrionales bacterium RIFOXYD1_FULL_39_84]OFZ95468.1 MAG: